MSKESRRFRVASDRSGEGGMVPWSLGERAYARHQELHTERQSIERLAERGGFSYSEMLGLGISQAELEAALSLDPGARRCLTCRHWHRSSGPAHPDHGECRTLTDRTPQSAAPVIWMGDPDPGMRTRSTFGCTSHRA